MKRQSIANSSTGWAPAALALALAVTLSGCGRHGESGSGTGVSENGIGSASQRIVCGSPAVAEIVFALGCGDRVVGVSDYTVYPPGAMTKERIGGWANPNRERLLMLRPDIIVTQGEHPPLGAFARRYGIRLHAVSLDTLDDLYAAIRSIAEALGVADKGSALNQEIRSAIQAISDRVPAGPPKRVLLLMGRTPGTLSGLSAVGPGTFLDDLLQVAGGTNLFADATGIYPQVSKEAILVREPEAILELHPDGLREEAMERLRADWRELSSVPAVRHDRIHFLAADFLLIPGPRVSQIAGAFASAIHGESARE